VIGLALIVVAAVYGQHRQATDADSMGWPWPPKCRTGGGRPRGQARSQRGATCQPPEHTPRERETWSKAEVRKFLAKASSDRLHIAWRLSLYGLRRGEVLGLRWSDIDLRAGTLTVNQARVLVDYRVRIEEPKSRNGKRTLPLDGELVAALTALRKRLLEESTIAGAAYRSGLAGLDCTRAAST
jgi:integrase